MTKLATEISNFSKRFQLHTQKKNREKEREEESSIKEV